MTVHCQLLLQEILLVPLVSIEYQRDEDIFHYHMVVHEHGKNICQDGITYTLIQGGKALTMTMTPRNLTHGQWSKNLTMATDILESASWSVVKMFILWLIFLVKSKVYLIDHRKLVFWPWSWSKRVF